MDCSDIGLPLLAVGGILGWVFGRRPRPTKRPPLPSIEDRVTAANLEQDERARTLEAERAAGLAQLAAREAEVNARHDAAREALRADPRAFIRDRLKGRE